MSNIGFNIYELTQKDMRVGTVAYSLLVSGQAYDFGDDKDGSSYLAIPCDDQNSNNLFLKSHPNAFLLSMGAISAGAANALFQKLLNKQIEMDDIPPAPVRNISEPDIVPTIITPPSKATAPKASPPSPPSPLPPVGSTPHARPRRPGPDLRSTDFRLKFFLDKKRRARIAAAAKTPGN